MKIRIAGWVFACLFFSAAGARCASAPGAKLMGIDIYGTDRVTSGELGTKYWGRIHTMMLKKGSKYPKDRQEAAKIQKELEDAVRKNWNLYWTRLSLTDYFSSGEHLVYATFDVLEKGDVRMRMPFRAAPSRSMADPGGLLAAWSQYSDLGWSLVRGGQITSDRPDCPAVYCLWDSLTPELKAFEARFIGLVPREYGTLLTIIREDKDPVHRANAVYLLGYAGDAAGLARVLDEPMHDPDAEVRGAALKVYSDLAIYHKEVHLPIERIAVALDYPTVEDRNRALAVLTAMTDNPAYRPYFIRRVTPQLIKLLRLEQPANHDLAYSILGILSRQKYDSRDFPSWEAWALRARAMPPEPPEQPK